MPLKNDGWKTSRSFKIGMVTFQGLHPWKFTKLKSGKSSEPSTSMTLRSMIIFQGVYVNVKLLGGKCRFSTFKRNSFDLVDVWMGGFNKKYRNEWMLGSNLCPSNFPHPQKCFKDWQVMMKIASFDNTNSHPGGWREIDMKWHELRACWVDEALASLHLQSHNDGTWTFPGCDTSFQRETKQIQTPTNLKWRMTERKGLYWPGWIGFVSVVLLAFSDTCFVGFTCSWIFPMWSCVF